MSPEVLSESINMRSFKNILKDAMGLVMWEITKRCKDDTHDHIHKFVVLFCFVIPA